MDRGKRRTNIERHFHTYTLNHMQTIQKFTGSRVGLYENFAQQKWKQMTSSYEEHIKNRRACFKHKSNDLPNEQAGKQASEMKKCVSVREHLCVRFSRVWILKYIEWIVSVAEAKIIQNIKCTWWENDDWHVLIRTMADSFHFTPVDTLNIIYIDYHI